MNNALLPFRYYEELRIFSSLRFSNADFNNIELMNINGEEYFKVTTIDMPVYLGIYISGFTVYLHNSYLNDKNANSKPNDHEVMIGCSELIHFDSNDLAQVVTSDLAKEFISYWEKMKVQFYNSRALNKYTKPETRQKVQLTSKPEPPKQSTPPPPVVQTPVVPFIQELKAPMMNMGTEGVKVPANIPALPDPEINNYPDITGGKAPIILGVSYEDLNKHLGLANSKTDLNAMIKDEFKKHLQEETPVLPNIPPVIPLVIPVIQSNPIPSTSIPVQENKNNESFLAELGLSLDDNKKVAEDDLPF